MKENTTQWSDSGRQHTFNVPAILYSDYPPTFLYATLLYCVRYCGYNYCLNKSNRMVITIYPLKIIQNLFINILYSKSVDQNFLIQDLSFNYFLLQICPSKFVIIKSVYHKTFLQICLVAFWIPNLSIIISNSVAMEIYATVEVTH